MAAPWFILGHFSFLSFRLLRFLHCFPFLELPLAFLGFVIGNNVGKYAPGDWFNDVLRNTGIVYGFAFAAHKFWSLRVILNFQGTTVDVRIGCWSMADLLFKFWLSKSPRVNVRSAQRSNLQTKCRHPSRVSASKLFCCVVIISSIQNTVNRTWSVEKLERKVQQYQQLFRSKMDVAMELYYPC